MRTNLDHEGPSRRHPTVFILEKKAWVLYEDLQTCGLSLAKRGLLADTMFVIWKFGVMDRPEFDA